MEGLIDNLLQPPTKDFFLTKRNNVFAKMSSCGFIKRINYYALLYTLFIKLFIKFYLSWASSVGHDMFLLLILIKLDFEN